MRKPMSNFVAHQRASMVGGLLVAVVSTALVRGLPALGGIRSTQWRQRSSIAAMVISDSSAGSQPKSISPEELLQLEAITKRGMSEMNKKRSRSTWRSARGQRGETLRRLRHSSSDRAAVARTIGELKPLQNPKEYSIAIDAMAKVRDGRGATALLDEMLSRHDVADPDVVCFSAAIRACGRAGQWRRALSVMADMERRGVAPNSHTFSAAISACAQGGHWQPALALLERMPLLGVPPNLYCFNSAIAACEKGAEWQRALELLERMELQGVRPDAFSFNSAISACEKGGRWDRALALLYLMERRGVLPDVISYSAAISACGKGGRWERALALMKAMQRRQIAPNLHSFNAAISACGAAGQPGPAVRLWEQLEREASLVPDEVSYNAILDALAFHDLPHERARARALWKRGVSRGLYSRFERVAADGVTPVLDLHTFSEGAAEVAVRWWIEERVPSIYSLGRDGASADRPVRLEVVTGWGKHRPVHQSSDLRSRVEAVLRDLDVPTLDSPNPGVQACLLQPKASP